MNLLRLLVRTSRWWLVLSGVAGVVSGAGSAALAALVGRVLVNSEPLTTLFLLRFCAVLILVIVMEVVSKWISIHMTTQASLQLTLELAERVLFTPLNRLERIGKAKLTSALVDDIIVVTQAFAVAPGMIVNVAIMVFCLAYLFWLMPLAFAFIGLCVVPALLVHWKMDQRVRRDIRAGREARKLVLGNFLALLEGTKELKMHRPRRQAFWHDALIKALFSHRDYMARSRRAQAVIVSWNQAIFFIFVLALFILATVMDSDPAVLTAYAVVALYMRSAVNSVMGAIPQWRQAAITFERLEEFTADLGDPEVGLTLNHREQEQPVVDEYDSGSPVTVELRSVSHAYRNEQEDRNFHLGPIDLTLKSGQLVFIIGANGSGKTTLLKLIAGLYQPDEGEILLNDQVVTTETLDAYRQKFTVLFADHFVFSELFGIDKANLDTRAQEYLHKLQLDHKLSIQNGQLSTTALSQGQRSRLALLTAYLEDRPIYIFDEWAASQDPYFKDLFYRQFLPELRNRGKLVIVISHDDHYYDVADRVIKLYEGQIETDTERSTWQPVYEELA